MAEGWEKGIMEELPFKILIHQNSDNLHLKLMGRFDADSAHQLIHVLSKYSHASSRIFIHTSGLEIVHPNGQEWFQSRLPSLNERAVHLVFTGEKAVELAPREGSFPFTVLP